MMISQSSQQSTTHGVRVWTFVISKVKLVFKNHTEQEEHNINSLNIQYPKDV